MASASSAAPAAAAQEAPKPIVYPCDTQLAGRDVWLVKVPEVIAKVFQSAEAPTEAIGSFKMLDQATSTQPGMGVRIGGGIMVGGGVPGSLAARMAAARPAAAGGSAEPPAKRARLQLQFTLDPKRVEEVMGAEGAASTPASYLLTLEPPTGQRVLSFSDATGFSLIGQAARQGQLLPDTRDPKYQAYAKLRREAEIKAERAKKRTQLAGDDVGPVARAQALAAQRAAAEAEAATDAWAASLAAVAAPQPVNGIMPGTARSIYKCFDRVAYWSAKDLATAMGVKEADIRSELAMAGEYVPRGPHRGTWKLKPSYRSVSSAKTEANDGIVEE